MAQGGPEPWENIRSNMDKIHQLCDKEYARLIELFLFRNVPFKNKIDVIMHSLTSAHTDEFYYKNIYLLRDYFQRIQQNKVVSFFCIILNRAKLSL